MFIAIGIISLLAFLLMRQEATAPDAVLGEAFVAIYYRAFLVGPGFFAGFANGVILGYMMYRSGLVPRGMSMLGLIGGPLVMASGIAVMFDVTERRRSRRSRRFPSSLGAVARYLLHRQGIQALLSDPRPRWDSQSARVAER